MKSNKLRAKLEAGEPTVSTHFHSTWPSVVEAIGHAGGYDYVEFVAEYGSFDLPDLDNICRAAELHGMESMIKVDQSHQAFLAQRGIGAGFTGVLFTDLRSAEDARQCVRIARPDTPEDGGLYGVATRRNSYAAGDGTAEYVAELRQTVVAIMIEKKGAVENLEEILSVPGIDMIQWGPADYSMSMGRPAQYDHPDILNARKKVFTTAMKMGIPPRVEIESVDEAKEYLDIGVRHFSIGTDITILQSWWQSNGAKLWRAIEGE